MKYSALLSPLIAAIGKHGFAEALARVAACIPHDASALMLFRDPVPPLVLVDRLRPEERGTLYGDYLPGVYQLSPFHRAAQGLTAAIAVRVKDVAPKGFTSSEYYRRYFSRIGVSDMLGILIPCGDGTVLFLSLSRSTGSFARTEVAEINSLMPVVQATVRRHIELAGPFAAKARRSRPNHAADSPLTRREEDVVRLILAGHSSRSLAAVLGISSETVRVHRRHIYEKLGVSSQAELFRWFLTSRRA